MRYNEEGRLREQIGVLAGLLSSPHDSTCKWSIIQLSMIGKVAVPCLLSPRDNMPEHKEDLTSHSVTSLTNHIAEALGMTASPRSVPLPEEFVQRTGSTSRAQALVKIGDNAASPVSVL